MGSKYISGPKYFEQKKFWVPKNFWPKNNLGAKIFWVQKYFWSKRNLGSTKFRVQKDFSCDKFLDQNCFILDCQIILVSKNFHKKTLVKENFGTKKCWAYKVGDSNIYIKKILGQNFFFFSNLILFDKFSKYFLVLQR